MVQQQIQSSYNKINNFQISSGNNNLDYQQNQKNPANRSDTLSINLDITSNNITISPQTNNLSISGNSFVIGTIDNNISLNILCKSDQKYFVDFDMMKKKIDSSNLKILIEFCQDVTDKIGNHFQIIGNLLLNIINSSDNNYVENDFSIDAEEKIKNIYRDIVLYVREDLEKIKELIYYYYNEDESFEYSLYN